MSEGTRGCVDCGACKGAARGSDGKVRCKGCFTRWMEDSVMRAIRDEGLFQKGERVALAVSGGKDSTALINVMHTLNGREALGLDLQLLCIDEGIAGYRDKSLETVERNRRFYGLPLLVLSFEDLFGHTLDGVAGLMGPTKKNTCSFCGVFRRHALDAGAQQLGCAKVATGHNADDAAETVLLNRLSSSSTHTPRRPSRRALQSSAATPPASTGAGAPRPRATAALCPA